MTPVAIVALSMWAGQAVLPLLLTLAALRQPGLALAGGAIWIVVNRIRAHSPVTPDDEARVLDRIVGELDGGASPRAAVVRSARTMRSIDLSIPVRMIEAGIAAPEIAVALGDAFPHTGRLVAASWALAADAGAPASPVMRLLARRASERGRLARERRTLTAQARATAWLIAGTPLGVCLGLLVTGRIGPGPALPVVLAGCALQLIGVAIVVLMIRWVG